jgi:hypothetical protein
LSWRVALLTLACAATSSAAPATAPSAAPTAPPPTAPSPARVWLVVLASNTSAEAIARRAKAMALALPPHLIVQTRDCGARDNVFALAVLADSADAANVLLPRVQPVVPDAYVKRCDVVPRSLLALRTSVIDPSIYDVPADAVNWDDAARVSEAVPLPEGRTLIVQRYFVSDPEDPLEGRRERVLLPHAPNATLLQNDCPSAGAFSARAGRIAFECAREQAGDALLHEVVVVTPDGAALASIPHCRGPRWVGPDSIVCDAESVDADGQLTLREKRTELPRKAAAAGKP